MQAVAGDSAEELELQLSFGDARLTWNTTTGKEKSIPVVLKVG